MCVSKCIDKIECSIICSWDVDISIFCGLASCPTLTLYSTNVHVHLCTRMYEYDIYEYDRTVSVHGQLCLS